MSDRLNIRYEMARLDSKDRGFYDSLTDEERKKFSNFLMIRWSSQVTGPRELQEYYVQSCNHYLNKHFFAINRHPKLQWLSATAVSPNTGCHTHNWVAPKKKEDKDKTSSASKKTLMELLPTTKMADIEVLNKMLTKKEVQELLREHGITDKN